MILKFSFICNSLFYLDLYPETILVDDRDSRAAAPHLIEYHKWYSLVNFYLRQTIQNDISSHLNEKIYAINNFFAWRPIVYTYKLMNIRF